MKIKASLQDKSLMFKISSLIVMMLFGAVLSSLLAGSALSFYKNVSINQALNVNLMTVNEMLFIQMFSVFGLFVIPSLIFNKWFNVPISPQKIDFGLMGVAIIIMMVALPGINWLAEINSKLQLPSFLSGIEEWMKESELKAEFLTDKLLSVTSISGYLFNIMVVAILAAVSEELFFRGVLQNTFYKYGLNIHNSIWVTAILFSAIHMQFYGFVPRMLLGVVLGYMYFWSGCIWIPILAHFTNNFIGVTLAFAIANGKISPEIEDLGSNGVLLPFVSIGLTITLLIYMHKQITLVRNK